MLSLYPRHGDKLNNKKASGHVYNLVSFRKDVKFSWQ
jgi:hypothetical protein